MLMLQASHVSPASMARSCSQSTSAARAWEVCKRAEGAVKVFMRGMLKPVVYANAGEMPDTWDELQSFGPALIELDLSHNSLQVRQR